MGTPATLGPEYFRDIGAVIAASAGGPPDMPKLYAVMQRHGLEPSSLSPAAQGAL